MNTKRKLFIAFFATLSLFSFAGIDNTHIKDSYVIVKYKIGGALETFTKEQTYKIVLPTTMNYNQDRENTYCWSSLYTSMAAKRTKTNDATYKTIEIVTQGLIPENTYEDIEVATPDNPSQKGWVREISYSFPIKLILRNAANEIEKELILHNDTKIYQSKFHAGFFGQNPNFPNTNTQIIPYASKAELQRAIASSKDAIWKQLEKEQVRKYYYEIQQAIAAAYDCNKISAFNMTYYQINKKEQANFPQFVAMSDKFQTALKDLGDDTRKEEGLRTLQECDNFYKEQLASSGKLPIDIIKLCLYHRAITALMFGNTTEANKYFSSYFVKYMQTGTFGEQQYEENFKKIYEVYVPYYQIKQSTETNVLLDVPIPAYTDKKIADIENTAIKLKQENEALEAEAAQSPNINGKHGYIVFKNRQTLEGKVSIHFVDLPSTSGIIDMDRFSSVDIEVMNNGVAEKRRYPSTEVICCIIEGKRYYHLDVQESGIMGALSKATGNSGPYLFYLKCYDSGGYDLFQNPAGNDFYITRTLEKKAYRVTDILKGKKAARPFIDPCIELKQKVDSKDISDISDPKTLTDWLATHY